MRSQGGQEEFGFLRTEIPWCDHFPNFLHRHEPSIPFSRQQRAERRDLQKSLAKKQAERGVQS